MKLVITGHRPDKLGGYSTAVLTLLVNLAMDEIRLRRPDEVIDGLALGWDMACAIATIKLRDEEHLPIKLFGYVPFRSQEKRWRDDTLVRMYNKIISKADQVIYLQDAEPKDAGQAIEWLNARNERMVDDGDKILALHNGSKGGTWNCIHYAEKMARPIHNAWPAWVKIMWPPKPKPVQ